MLLPEETIAVYLQSALKVFGHWAAEVSKRWDENLLAEVKGQVEIVLSNLDRFVSSSYIEVQERVSSSGYTDTLLMHRPGLEHPSIVHIHQGRFVQTPAKTVSIDSYYRSRIIRFLSSSASQHIICRTQLPQKPVSSSTVACSGT